MSFFTKRASKHEAATETSQTYWDPSYGPNDISIASTGSSVPKAPLHHLPPGHPPVPAHTHAPGSFTCPFATVGGAKAGDGKGDGDAHGYCPPQEGDSRSVCPALNSMANHGFIPRNGHNITVTQLINGLTSCFNLSLPLATFLSSGGYLLAHRPLALIPFSLPSFIRKGGKGLSLYEFCVHNGTEHNASIVHRDIDPSEADAGAGKGLYPPFGVVEKMVEDMIDDLEPKVDKKVKENFLHHWRSPRGGDGAGVSANDIEQLESITGSIVINADDIARIRVRLEDSLPLPPQDSSSKRKRLSLLSHFSKPSSPPTHGQLDFIHAQIARGEVSIVLSLPSWKRTVSSSNLAFIAAAGPGAGKEVKEGVVMEWFLRFLLYETLPLTIVGGGPSVNGDATVDEEVKVNGHHRLESSIWGSIRHLSLRGRPVTAQSDVSEKSEKSRSPTPGRNGQPQLVQWSPFLRPTSPSSSFSTKDVSHKSYLKKVTLRVVGKQTDAITAKMKSIRSEKHTNILCTASASTFRQHKHRHNGENGLGDANVNGEY